MADCFDNRIPVLVPCRHLSYEHIGHGRAETGALVIRGAGLGGKGCYGLEVPDQRRPRGIGRHPGKHRNPFEVGVVQNRLHVERNITEEGCEQPVVEAAQRLHLAEEVYPLLIRKGFRVFDALNREVALANTLVALIPHCCAETRLHGGDVELGIEGAGGYPHDVGRALGSHEEGRRVDALYGGVAAVHHALALGILAEEVVRGRQRVGVLFEGTGRDRQSQYQ